jgi:cytoskeletal protein RodZ
MGFYDGNDLSDDPLQVPPLSGAATSYDPNNPASPTNPNSPASPSNPANPAPTAPATPGITPASSADSQFAQLAKQMRAPQQAAAPAPAMNPQAHQNLSPLASQQVSKLTNAGPAGASGGDIMSLVSMLA